MELLNHMALFVEVVKAKGFRKAGEILDIPSSTVSRRISELEKEIGLRLLNRTTRKIELTEAGQLYFERGLRIVNDARLAHEQLSSMAQKPSGLLRISLSVEFGAVYLAPLLAEFASLYPDINFQLDLSPRRIDLISEPFDVAIRMGSLSDSTLIARQIMSLPRYLYASPAYLEKYGEPAHPDDLIRHQCLKANMSENLGAIWPLFKGKERTEVVVNGRFSLNNISMIKSLAVSGMGIAILTEEIAKDDVRLGRIKQILPEWQMTPVSVYALTETRLLPAKTQLFIEFLRVHLERVV